MSYKEKITYIWNLQWITHLIHLIASAFVNELFANGSKFFKVYH
jgi:hypothetical protein